MVSTTEVIDWISINFDWLSITVIVVLFSLISMRYFRNKDKTNPPSYLLLLFIVILGIISVVPAVILSLILSIFVPEPLTSVIVAPIAEEIAKGLFVGLIARSWLIKDPMDGLVYGAMIGTGFAAFENFLYAYSQFVDGGLSSGLFLASFRSAFILIGHPLYTGITGYGIGFFKLNDHGRKYGKIWLAMILHASWNSTSVFFADIWLVAFGSVIIISIIILKFFINKAQKYDTG